jgi:hemoglobin
MNDIETRNDIELLVKEFYAKVRKNETLGPIFDDIMKINWDHHIPILIDFWETILLDNPVYRRNAMGVHFEVNEKIKLLRQHFTTWLFLFDSTVDEYFEGDKAALAKKRAHDIANLMLFKMDKINKNAD